MAKDSEPPMGHFLSLGLYTAVGVGLGYWIGSWLDEKYGYSPWGTLVGVAAGLAGGMYLLIKEGVQANKD